MDTCDLCGKRIPAGSLFCPSCGDPVTEADRAGNAMTSRPNVQLVCPACGHQTLYELPPNGGAQVPCVHCRTQFWTRVMKVQSKRSAGNKRFNTRRFTVRVRDLVGRDDLIEFERPMDEDFEMRSRDLVAFSGLGGAMHLVQNLTLGRYMSLVRPPAPAAPASSGGCGCLAAAVVLTLMLGFCSVLVSVDDDRPVTRSTSSLGRDTYRAPATEPHDVLYLHGDLNLRAAPGGSATLLRTLRRGEMVRLGPKDSRGWAPMYDAAGTRQGYVFRASRLVQAAPPSTSAPSSRSTGSTRASSRSSSGYYTGPRGGCYTYSASGRKRYVDRSYCN